MRLFSVYIRHCTVLGIFFLLWASQPSLLSGQNHFYDNQCVQEVRIELPQPGWREILDSLMKSGDDSTRITGSAVINGTRIKGVGVRYKGFSSWNYGEVKNPFNLELDYLVNNRNYQGTKKIRLSNVIHDPSFIREALGYTIARRYMPASEASFALLYVNDTLLGLYSNVESVDDVFMEKHFGNPDYPLIKGSPGKLEFPFGNNANLSFISSTDSNAYRPYYQLVSTYGWERLMRFIDILNNHPDSLEHVLDIDRALWMHAFNYATSNLDSYIGYAQNYYLAMDRHGRFNTIPWDLNMSFGSFRSSDGSTHFQGLTIEQVKKLDPLQHLTFSISPRPLMRKLFEDSTLRRMYLAHLRTIINDFYLSAEAITFASDLQVAIDSLVQADVHKFYTYADFLNNLHMTVGGTGTMTTYVGVRELIEARIAYLWNYPGFRGEPVITMLPADPVQPSCHQMVHIGAGITGADEAWLCFRQSSEGLFARTPLYDDGMHDDGLAGDGIFGTGVLLDGDIFQYYLYAQNDSAGAFSPEGAEYSVYTVYPKVRQGHFVINEMKKQVDGHSENSPEESSRWIEFFSNSMEPISIQGLYLSNDPGDLKKWPFPDSLIPPHGYMMVWVDGPGDSVNHCNFILNDQKGWIGISYGDGSMIDTLSYALVDSRRSLGRYPNGYGAFTLMPPTPAARNAMGESWSNYLLAYPNPVSGHLFVEWLADGSPTTLRLLSSAGAIVMEWSIPAVELQPGIPGSAVLDVSQCKAGLYLIQVIPGGQMFNAKVMIY